MDGARDGPGIDAGYDQLLQQLSAPGYAETYSTEAAFEVDVWKRVVSLVKRLALDPQQACLTSPCIHSGRSEPAWQEFCASDPGPDVRVLGSDNRLDIVLRHERWSIGIEIKSLRDTGHTGTLTQGLGQALLGLANRDRTVLMIHCGTVDIAKRDELRRVAACACWGINLGVVVVGWSPTRRTTYCARPGRISSG